MIEEKELSFGQCVALAVTCLVCMFVQIAVFGFGGAL